MLEGRWDQARAEVIAALLPAEAWQRLSAGDGAKRPRWYDWAQVRLARLQLTAEERRWDHWLLVRRSRRDPTDMAYYVVCAPAGTTLRTLVRVAGQRWRIERLFAEASATSVGWSCALSVMGSTTAVSSTCGASASCCARRSDASSSWQLRMQRIIISPAIEVG